jgi:hypothetical protein
VELKTANQLCRAEIERFRAAAKTGDDIVIGCTQEAPLFSEVAGDRTGALSFANVRETAGWSADATKAGPKMAALLAVAAEPLPEIPFVSLESEGVALIYGRDEHAIEAGKLLADHLDVTVLIARSKGLPPPRVSAFPVVQGTIKSAKGHLGAFEVVVDDYAVPAPSSRGALSFGVPRDGAVSRCDLIIDLSGGAPQVIAEVGGVRAGTWSGEGVIVFAKTGSGLMRVSATGGTPVEVTHLAPGQPGHRWPQFLPDGRHVLFLVAGGGPAPSHGIYVASLDGGEPRRVVAAEQNAMYAPPGYLLRVSQGVLVAQKFDAARATVTGDPFSLAQAVGQTDGQGLSAFSVSAAGILAHRSGAAAGTKRQLVWFDRAGKVLGTVGQPDENSPTSLALAPDDRRVANGRIVQGNPDIWLIEVGRDVATRFTFDPAAEFSPIWSPDGSRVVFRSARNGARARARPRRRPDRRLAGRERWRLNARRAPRVQSRQ